MQEVRLRTQRRSQLVDITEQVREAVAEERGSAVLVYVPHTTAGVTVNEHADPAVARDFEKALERLVDDRWGWEHVELGEENAPTHIARSHGTERRHPAARDGSLALGTWQGIFFCEFDGPRDRTAYVSVLAKSTLALVAAPVRKGEELDPPSTRSRTAGAVSHA